MEAREADRDTDLVRTIRWQRYVAKEHVRRRHDAGFSKAWRAVADGKEKGPADAKPQRPHAPSAHRRPGYSSSGCTPAEPNSASPGEENLAGGRRVVQNLVGGMVKAGSARPRKNLPAGRTCKLGKDAPQEIKKDFGRSRGRCLDFLLLIGAFADRGSPSNETDKIQ